MVKDLFKDWIERSDDSELSSKLLKAFNANSYEDLSAKIPEITVVGDDVWIVSVDFDETTNTFTFVMSTGEVKTIQVGVTRAELDNYVKYDSSRNIVLEGDKSLMTTRDALNVNLIKLSGVNITEVGSASFQTNINSSSVPTVQLPNADSDTIVLSRDLVSKANVTDVYNKSEVYTKTETDDRIRSVVGAAPEALDTLKELADALGNDADFTSTITNKFSSIDSSLATKATKEDIAEVCERIPNAYSKSESDAKYSTKKELTAVQATIVDSYSRTESDELYATNDGLDALAQSVSELDSKSVKYQEFGDKTRKTIQLNNYDSVSGLMTDGTGVNVAMVSKWDVVDLGSNKLPINLNTPAGVRPTVQEEGQSGEEANQIAYVSDLSNLATKDELNEIDAKITDHVDAYTKVESDDRYATKEELTAVDEKITDHVDAYTKVESDSKYSTKEELAAVDAKITEHVDAYTKSESDEKYQEKLSAGTGITIIDNVVATDIDLTPYLTTESAESTYATKSELPVSSELCAVAKVPIRTLSSSKVYDKETILGWFGVTTELDLKNIIINKGQMYLVYGISYSGNPYYYRMPVEYIAFESATQVKIVFNGLNTRNDAPVKYELIMNLDGTIIKDSTNVSLTMINLIQTEYDDSTVNANISNVLSRLNSLEDRVSAFNKSNIEPVIVESGVASESLSDTTKDYSISGTVDSGNLVVSGKSVSLSNTEVSNDSRLKLTATDDVDIKSVSFSGDFPKSTGNAAVSVNNSGYVVIKDMVFDATLYNAVEIGLSASSKVRGVLIDNCQFRGTFSNNAILIFNTEDNAVVNISNCYFENVSNCIRISNRDNVHVTVNITNCKCDHWDTTAPWQGMLICQDYTSGSVELEESNNLFAPEKVVINISNFITPSGNKLAAPSDMSTICGSSDENQVLYVWNSKGGSISYGDGSRYPTINIA